MCLFPETKPDLSFNDKGICSACLSSKNKDFEIDWDKRKTEFEKIINNVKAVDYFGSQCISIVVDAIFKEGEYWIHNNNDEKILMKTFVEKMHECNVGVFVVNSVNNDGMMNGFDKAIYQKVTQITSKPIVALGGAGSPSHFTELVQINYNGALAAASIYHFTQYTPQEIKKTLNKKKIPVRI